MPVAPFIFSIVNYIVCGCVWYVCACKLTNLCLSIVYCLCMMFGGGEGTGTKYMSNYSGGGSPSVSCDLLIYFFSEL